MIKYYLGIARVSGKKFGRELKHYCNRYEMDMVGLQETGCGGIKANNTIEKLGFYKNMRIEARGFARGIWLIWNIYGLQITLVKENQHFLHVNLSDGTD